MGNLKSPNKKGVFLMVGIILAITVAGSFVETDFITAADDFRYLRF